jgi:hypothetical protein
VITIAKSSGANIRRIMKSPRLLDPTVSGGRCVGQRRYAAITVL